MTQSSTPNVTEPAQTTDLTFEQLRRANLQRLPSFPPAGHGEEWTPNDWAVALAGEVGEACNLLKKVRRGESIPITDIARELADAQIYLDLLAWRLGLDLGYWTATKFNEVSFTKRIDVYLQPETSA
jgi:NTP pyrophosphatase (non-canonical NTP hydrolase)